MQRLKRYTLPIVLGALTLILLVVGILSVTIWKPAQAVSAERSTEQAFTSTHAGLLRLYQSYQDSPSVRVEATVPGDQIVWLALGAPEDVKAWLSNESYDEIVGLADIQTLKAIPHDSAGETAQSGEDATEAEDGEESSDQGSQSGEEAAVNPIDSDMWTAMKYGHHSVSMDLKGDELDQVLLAATDGTSPAPTIKLTWSTPQSNVLALAAFSLMGAFALLTLGTFAALFVTRPKRRVILPAEQHETLLIEGPHAESDFQPEAVDEESEIETEPEPEVDVLDAEADEEAESTSEVEPEFVQAPAPEPVEEVDSEPEPTSETKDEVPPVSDPEAPHSSAGVEETVPTDSGMINLAALQSGFGYPTRRALRDAEKRGVETLVVGDRRFATKTGEIPRITVEETVENAKEQSRRTLSWSQLMGQASQKASSESETPDNEGE